MLLFLLGSSGVPDIAQLNPELGASIYFQGVNLFINRSFFKNNTGFKGGALYIVTTPLNLHQNVLITECNFNGNRGNVGASINFSIYLRNITSTINSSIFYSNIGKSILLNQVLLKKNSYCKVGEPLLANIVFLIVIHPF